METQNPAQNQNPYKFLVNPKGEEELYKVYVGWMAKNFYKKLARVTKKPEDYIVLGVDALFTQLTPDIISVNENADKELVKAVKEYLDSYEYKNLVDLTRFNEPLSAYYTWNFMAKIIELIERKRNITPQDVLNAMRQAASAASAAKDLELPNPLDSPEELRELGEKILKRAQRRQRGKGKREGEEGEEGEGGGGKRGRRREGGKKGGGVGGEEGGGEAEEEGGGGGRRGGSRGESGGQGGEEGGDEAEGGGRGGLPPGTDFAELELDTPLEPLPVVAKLNIRGSDMSYVMNVPRRRGVVGSGVAGAYAKSSISYGVYWGALAPYLASPQMMAAKLSGGIPHLMFWREEAEDVTILFDISGSMDGWSKRQFSASLGYFLYNMVERVWRKKLRAVFFNGGVAAVAEGYNAVALFLQAKRNGGTVIHPAVIEAQQRGWIEGKIVVVISDGEIDFTLDDIDRLKKAKRLIFIRVATREGEVFARRVREAGGAVYNVEASEGGALRVAEAVWGP
jgi:uncharacterized protein with von Willebrand factor type A (vWA) domain